MMLRTAAAMTVQVATWATLLTSVVSFTAPRSNTNHHKVVEPRAIRMPTTTTTTTTTLHALEAILWDMDGVLADTERDAHRPAFNVAFDEQGLETEWDVDRYGKLLHVGGGKERMTAHWNEVGWPEAFSTITSSDDDDDDDDDEGEGEDEDEEGKRRQAKVKELHLRKTDIFMDMIQEGNVPLRPGVLRLIDEAIDANLRLAVCSTSNEKAVRNLVQTLMGPDRADKFQIFAGDMVTKKKPAPDVYLMAVDQMGLDKSKCVIVEDSHIGLGAALAAGIKCIVTKSSYTAGEDFTGATMVVEELGNDPSAGVTLETLESLLGPAEPPALTPKATKVKPVPLPVEPAGEAMGVSAVAETRSARMTEPSISMGLSGFMAMPDDQVAAQPKKKVAKVEPVPLPLEPVGEVKAVSAQPKKKVAKVEPVPLPLEPVGEVKAVSAQPKKKVAKVEPVALPLEPVGEVKAVSVVAETRSTGSMTEPSITMDPSGSLAMPDHQVAARPNGTPRWKSAPFWSHMDLYGLTF